MKKNIIIVIVLFLVSCTATREVVMSKKKERQSHFSVKDCTVYYHGKPFAKYQAKTFSLDGGELVEEYNLALLDNKVTNKQTIGDLIDFVSDRHRGAEVEIEVDSNGSVFNL